MRTRKTGGGCNTMYCTNLSEGELVKDIRNYYLATVDIWDPENDTQDRSNIKPPEDVLYVEALIKEHCKFAHGDKQCVFDPFSRYGKPEKLSNRRVDMKKLSVQVHNAILNYFTPEALAERKNQIEIGKRRIIAERQRAEFLKKDAVRKEREQAELDAVWRRGGKRRTRKRR